jgi:hypothetical protein
VVSGTGLPNIYDYLCVIFPEKINPEITAKLETAGDMKVRVRVR